jgi:hypothetical protein
VEELKKEKEKLEEILQSHIPQCTMHQNNIVLIPDNAHLLHSSMCLSPEAGIPLTPNPDTPNPTTPRTPGQTFSFSPVPFNTSMPEELYPTTDDDICPSHDDVCTSHTNLAWLNTEDIQTTEFPSDYDANLDGCFGSEFENIDIAPFTCTENTQCPVANEGEMQFDYNHQQSGLPIPDNTPGENAITSGENMTTLSGLEAVLTLLVGDTGAYATHGNMNEISQHGQNISCTDLHDI